LLSSFFRHIHKLLETVEKKESEAMFTAAKKVVEIGKSRQFG